SHHHLENSRLYYLVHVFVQHGKSFRCDRELNRCFLTRLQRNALKSFQLHDRSRDRSDLLMDIELRDLIPLAIAGITYIHVDLRSPAESNLRRLDLEIFKLKGRIAQSVSEWIERLACAEGITAVRRRLVIVEIRQIANRARKRNW